MKGEPLETRFWNRVLTEGGDECWLWIGARQTKGYGLINLGEGRGKNILAHRLSWMLAYGEIPDGKSVLHRCDNPGCVRPDHLWLGTAADNTNDMMKKGRGRTGFAKLTTDEVLDIRHRASSGESIDNISRRFPKVSPKSVWRVATGRTFRTTA